MAFGELYRLEYRDQPLGRLSTLKILQDGITAPYTEVIGNGDPVTISTNSDSDYLFNQIHGSECEINLISEVSYQFIGLFSANAFKTKIELWKEPEPGETQTLFWTGWLLPDQYSEPIDFEKDYQVNLVARDGLGALKDIDFLQDTGNKYVGKKQVVKIIAEILKKTKLDLNINIGINLLEENAGADVNGDTMGNIYLDYAVFYQDKTMNCLDVLTQILQSFGARIIQADGQWWIERIPMYLAAQTIYKYDKDGKYISKSIVQNQINYTGKYDVTNNRLYFRDKKGNLEINPAYKKFVIEQDYGKLKSVLKNYDFTQYTLTKGAPNPRSEEIEYIQSFNNWTIYPLNSQSPTQGWGYSTNKSKLAMNSVQAVFDSTKRIESDSVQLTLSDIKGLLIRFTTEQLNGTTRLEIKFGARWIDGDGNLQTSQTFVETSLSQDVEIKVFPASEETNYFKVIVWALRIAGVGNRGYGYLSPIEIEFLYKDGDVYPENATYEVTIDSDNNEVPETIGSILGDIPELEDNEDLYIGGYWYFDGTNFIPTKSWTVFASSRELTLMTILGEAINDQYRNPKHKITAALHGNFKLNKCIFVSMLQNKLYLPVRTVFSDKYCLCNIEMLEIVTETEGEGGIVWGDHNQDYVVSETDVLTKV